MRLKKCSGCARAIVESSAACEHCGFREPDPIVDAAGVEALLSEEQPRRDGGHDDFSALPGPIPPRDAAALRDSAADAAGFEYLFDDWDTPPVMSDSEPLQAEPPPDPVTASAHPDEESLTGYVTAVAPQDAIPAPSLTGSGDPEAERAAPADEQSLSDDALTDPVPADSFDLSGLGTYEIEDPAQAPETAAAPAAQMPHPVAAKAGGSRVGPRELLTGALGVLGGGFLIFAMLTSRGAATPEAASAAKPAPTPPQPAAVVAQAEVPMATAPKWSNNAAFWTGNARNTAAFEVAAANRIQVWTRRVLPLLVVRCQARRAEVFVFTDSAAKMEPQDGNHTVRIRFDDQPELIERWPDSAEHDALFAPDGPVFLEKLVAARTLTFGFSPHNANPAVARFDVTGLSEHLTGAARQCGWK